MTTKPRKCICCWCLQVGFQPCCLGQGCSQCGVGDCSASPRREQRTKMTFQSQLLLSPKSSRGAQGSCCPLGCPGVGTECLLQGSASLLHHGRETHIQKWRVFFPLLPERHSGAFSEHDRLQNSAIPFHPSTGRGVWDDAMSGWGTRAKDRFWKLNRGRQQILQKYVSAVHARFWLITTNRVKLSFNPSEFKSRTDSPSLLSLSWVYMCKHLFKPSLVSSALQMSAFLLSLFCLNFVGGWVFLALKTPQSRFL